MQPMTSYFWSTVNG